MSDSKTIVEALLTSTLKRFPSLGDPRKRYAVVLNEMELNAMAASGAFVKAACHAGGADKYWQHYGPTLERLAARFQQYEDGNAPYSEEDFSNAATLVNVHAIADDSEVEL